MFLASRTRGNSYSETRNCSDESKYVKARFIKDGEQQELLVFAISEDNFDKIEHDIVQESEHPSIE